MSGFLIILYIGWGLLRTILIIVLVYYIFKIIGKIVFTSAINHAKANARQNQQRANRRGEGEVTIVTGRKKSSKYDRKEGEYIDFEEID
ncbi:MAG: DUF4834 family protein [Prolixibacteraceae bacterium]|jgi:hypothetical protein|nr:DUF4834 family protein [Prolixibacteraceae bacterium]